MIATLSLFLFIIVYITTFLFHPPLFILVFILLLQAAFLIVIQYEKSILLLCIIAQGILFIPFIMTDQMKQQLPLSMYGNITSLEGSVMFDSTLSAGGNRVVTLKVKKMSTSKGVTLYVHKNIITIIRRGEPLYVGTDISVQGNFFIAEDGTPLFMSNSYSVVEKNLMVLYRERVIDEIKKRIIRMSEKNKQLVLLISLGIKEDGASHITTLAVEKGVAHLFALSGMHLSVLLSVFTLLISSIVSTHKSRLLTLFIALLYLWIAGNKPSLVRSILFLILSVIPYISSRTDRFICVVLLHSLLSPTSMMTLAALYSYTAIYSILIITPYITSRLEPYLPRLLASSFSLTIGAMSITSIVSLCMFNSFTPIGFLYTQLLTPIILLLLITSLLYISFPIRYIHNVLEKICDLTFSILEGERVDFFTFSPRILYSMFLFFLLTLFLLLCYSQKQKQTRNHISYEMDISLRIKLPDKVTP